MSLAFWRVASRRATSGYSGSAAQAGDYGGRRSVREVRAVPDQIVEILNEDGHDILSMRIADAQEVQRCEEARLGSAFIDRSTGPNALGKLSRYETALFRRRNQALETLSKLHAQRNEASPGDAE